MASKPATNRTIRSLFSSLRSRLFLLVALAVVPVLGVMLYNAVEQRHVAVIGVQETALRLARLASTQQGQMILGTRQLLIGLAQLPEVRQPNPGACNSLFAELLKAYRLYANLGALDLQGDVYCSALPINGRVNAADRPYFQRAVSSADFSIGDYQIGRITGVAAINFGYPVLDEARKVKGVVFAALSLNWVNQVVKEADLPPGSTFSVIDRNGKILIRYPESEKWVGKNAPEPLLVQFARDFRTGVAEAGGPDGVAGVIGFTPLLGRGAAGDVYVSIGIPKRIAYAEADRMLIRNLIWLGLIAAIAFAAAWFGGDFFVLRRVNALVGVAKQLAKGNLTTRVGPLYGQGELARLRQTFDEMAASLQKNAAQLLYQSTHDSLTGLPNRRFFSDHLQSSVPAARSDNERFALLLMDLDQFKEINDTIGHQNGDLLLKEATRRLKSAIGKTGIIARLGGDEFAVFLSITDPNRAVASAGEILKAFEEPFILAELPVAVEVSVGIALYHEHGADPDFIIRRAEAAMYLAKGDKSGYAIYSPDKDQYRPERITLLARLRRAVEQNQLFLVYHPKLDIRNRTIGGVEALVRWEHPQLGVIPPDDFIGLAERTALMKPLTFWVLGEALRQSQSWHQNGQKLSVAVNISSRNLEPDFPADVSRLLAAHNVEPRWLVLEITEGTLMKDPAHAKEILTRLCDMGIRISIDDFGTGYSSLSYLSQLPVHEVKIDKSFVMNMAKDENAAVIVRSTIELGHGLGLTVVAEGVESQEVLERLGALGCDSAQGYYISRPIKAAALTEFLGRYPSRL